MLLDCLINYNNGYNDNCVKVLVQRYTTYTYISKMACKNVGVENFIESGRMLVDWIFLARLDSRVVLFFTHPFQFTFFFNATVFTVLVCMLLLFSPFSISSHYFFFFFLFTKLHALFFIINT